MIATPMDLGTVKRKLEGKEYDTLESFSSDVKVTFSNCCEFNDPAALICVVANQLSVCFEGLLEAWVMSPTKPPVKKMTTRNADALEKAANSKRKKPKISAEAKAAAKAAAKEAKAADKFAEKQAKLAVKALAKEAKAAAKAAAKLEAGERSHKKKGPPPPKPDPGHCKAVAKKRLQEIYFNPNNPRLGEAESESEEGAEEEEEEEIILDDDLIVLQQPETTEAQQTVTLPSHKAYTGLPKELAPVALAVWDFAAAMRRRILSQATLGTDQRNKTFLTCSWEEFEYSLLNPHEPATESVIFYYLRKQIYTRAPHHHNLIEQ